MTPNSFRASSVILSRVCVAVFGAEVTSTNGASIRKMGLPTVPETEEKQRRSEAFVEPLSLS
jgi:hypothetical protein